MPTPPMWLPEWAQLLALGFGGLSVIAAAVLLPIHWNRVHAQAAEQRRAEAEGGTITALSERVRMLEVMVEAKDRDYESCQRRLAEVERQLSDMRWRAGHIG